MTPALTDDELLERLVTAAQARRPSVAEVSLLRAIASTREEARRRELEREARERIGQITAVGLQVLRTVLTVVV